MTKHLNAQEFQKLVLESSEPVIVDFYAEWCGPCKMLAPIIDEIDQEASGFHIYKLDVEQEGAIAQRYGIMSIPTIISFKNGKEYKKVMGYRGKQDILNLIK